MDRFHDFTCLYSSKTQKFIKKKQKSKNRLPNTDKGLRVKGRKSGKCKFSVEIWMDLQVQEEKKSIFKKKIGGS